MKYGNNIYQFLRDQEVKATVIAESLTEAVYLYNREFHEDPSIIKDLTTQSGIILIQGIDKNEE